MNSCHRCGGFRPEERHLLRAILVLAERDRIRTARFFEMLDRHLAGRQFVASDRYTIADIMALVTAKSLKC